MIIRASNGMAFGRTFDIPEAGEALSWNKKRKSWITYVPPSTAAAEVYPDATRPIGSVRMITWNVWFGKETNRTLRHRALAKHCFVSEESEADIVCLQEMTVEAYDELLGITPISDEDPLAQRARRTLDSLRKDWIVTPFLPHTLIYNRGIYFGTIILLRKSFVERLGASISLSAVPLPSQCDRCLHLASLTRDGKALLRIGTTHLDGAPIAVALRKAQLEHCAQHLIINDAPSILTGDFNNVTLDELDAIIAPPYSYTDSMRNFDTRPTYNTTYWLKGSNTQRIDFVLLSKEWEVEEGKVLGEEAVKLPKGMERPKRVAPDGKVYPSDHVGVWVRARLS